MIETCAIRGEAVPAPAANPFREALATPGQTVYAVELVPAERRLGRLLEFAAQARGLDVAVTLTDGAGGGTAPPPDPLAAELAQLMGRQPVVTVACKTASRDALVGRLAAIGASGLENVLVVTGDYPRSGGGSFPLDSVQLLLAASRLHASTPDLADESSRRPHRPAPAPLRGAGAGEGPEGRGPVPGQPGVGFSGSPAVPPWKHLDASPAGAGTEPVGRPAGRRLDLCLGAAVSPFKYTAGDLWGQRLKTWKKWQAGASFFATQIGFDVRKFQELRLWMARDGMAGVPVLASVYLLHAGTAGLLASGRLPGVYLPPDLAALASALTGATGRAVARRRAALLADVLVRGLGYRGVVFCGVDRCRDLADILDIQRRLAQQDWRESYEEYRRPAAPAWVADRELRFAPNDAWYLFPPGSDGLLHDGLEQPANHASGEPAAPAGPVLRWVHHLLFEPGQPTASFFRRALAAGDAAGLAGAITWLEQAMKSRLLGCQMCGDCRIAHLQFRCPEPARGCLKGLLNGPCAGATVDGRCEVDPQRLCYWRLVVESALARAELETLDCVQPPRDPALRGTSSWLNHAAGRTPAPVSLGAPRRAPADPGSSPPGQQAHCG